jgi:hypothetical protein
MELRDRTQEARYLTAGLVEALAGRNMESWLTLLDKRGEAMAAFEAAHRAATTAEREACRDIMMLLRNEDRELQERSEILLEQLAGEFRGQLGSHSHGTAGCEMPVGQACLDRKA